MADRWVEASADRVHREPDPAVRRAVWVDSVVIDSRPPAADSSMVFSVCQPIKACRIAVPTRYPRPDNHEAVKMLMPIMARSKVPVGVKRAVSR